MTHDINFILYVHEPKSTQSFQGRVMTLVKAYILKFPQWQRLSLPFIVTFPLSNIQQNWLNWNGTEPRAGRNIIVESILFMDSVWQLYDKVLRGEKNEYDHVKTLKKQRQQTTTCFYYHLTGLIFNTHLNNCHQSLGLIFAWCHLYTNTEHNLLPTAALTRGCWALCRTLCGSGTSGWCFQVCQAARQDLGGYNLSLLGVLWWLGITALLYFTRNKKCKISWWC